MSHDRSDHRPRDERRGRRATRRRVPAPLRMLVVIAVTVAVVLGAPAGVLTLVDGRRPAADPALPVPVGGDGDSVPSLHDVAMDAAAAGAGSGSDALTGRAAGMPPDGGRWGASAERPTVSGPHGSVLQVEELRGGWRVQAGAEEAAALGVLAAHAWARGGQGTGQGHMGGGAATTEHAAAVVLEAVERPGPSHAVVTVLVAQGDDVRRLAIPIVFEDGGPALAGAPWRLPSPSPAPLPLAGEPTADEVLVAAARDALERAGIRGSRLVRLEVTDGWPFIARLDSDADGHPWLRWHLDRFVVTGLPLDRAVEGS